MPADSEPLPPLPRTWRPFGPRIAALVFAIVLVVTFGMLWWSFDEQTKEAVNTVQRITVIIVLGTGIALLYAMGRSKLVATGAGLTLVNGFRRREYEWAEVIAIRMPPGAPWPTLDLADGTTVSALGIHGSDGARARDAVLEVKALLESRGSA